MSRPITEKQFGALLVFGSGAMLVSGADRQLRALVGRGWLAATNPGFDAENGLRITAEGFRALAVGVERYGLPGLKARDYPRATA